MSRSAHPEHGDPFRWTGWLALAGTVSLGTALRWVLAGQSLPVGQFHHLRSAHVHLGYYGVVFPFVWLAWGRLGLRIPGPRMLALYGTAVAASTVDFALEGYAPVSIVGSTVVLATWLAFAWPHRVRIARRDWLAPVFPAVICSAVAIPAVAVMAARGNPLAQDLVHSFLTWLLLGVAAATALRSTGFAPPPPCLHLATVIGSGLALGILPHWGTRALLALQGYLYVRAAMGSRETAVLRAAWSILGAGLVAVGAGWVPALATVAVAGIHYALLGPVLLTLAWPARRRVWQPAYLVLLLASCGAIGASAWMPYPWWPTLTAGLGSMVAAAWLGLGIAGILGRRAGAGPSEAPGAPVP